MMKDTRCQVFDISRKHISAITNGQVQSGAGHSLLLLQSSLSLSTFHFLSFSIFPPTYLSLPERSHAATAAAAAGERHSVKVPHQKPATAAWYHARRSILSRPTWSMDNAILGVNRWSPGEGETPRVVLDSDAKWIEWWIWASAFGVCTHRTFRVKCDFLIIDCLRNLFTLDLPFSTK